MDERSVARFETLTPEQRSRVKLNMMGQEFGFEQLALMRLSEHAMHAWDIEVSLDPSSRLSPDAVDALMGLVSTFAARIGKPQGRSFQLRVRTSNPESDLSLTVGDDLKLMPWDGGTADGELQVPAEAFLRLVYGRLDPDHTPELELRGDVTLDDLRAVFPGF